MKRLLTAAALSLALITAGATTRTSQAQDNMMTHVCDSTLIALLYIAEHDYGFVPMSADLSTFEKGQYAPLFEAMMSMMGEEAMMEGDDMMATEEAMMESEAMADSSMMEMVALTPGHVTDEDPACTELRTELDAFLFAALTESMMMMSDG